jgi:hypothetical protein
VRTARNDANETRVVSQGALLSSIFDTLQAERAFQRSAANISTSSRRRRGGRAGRGGGSGRGGVGPAGAGVIPFLPGERGRTQRGAVGALTSLLPGSGVALAPGGGGYVLNEPDPMELMCEFMSTRFERRINPEVLTGALLVCLAWLLWLLCWH